MYSMFSKPPRCPENLRIKTVNHRLQIISAKNSKLAGLAFRPDPASLSVQFSAQKVGEARKSAIVIEEVSLVKSSAEKFQQSARWHPAGPPDSALGQRHRAEILAHALGKGRLPEHEHGHVRAQRQRQSISSRRLRFVPHRRFSAISVEAASLEPPPRPPPCGMRFSRLICAPGACRWRVAARRAPSGPGPRARRAGRWRG